MSAKAATAPASHRIVNFISVLSARKRSGLAKILDSRSGVIFAIRRKDVQRLGIFKRLGLVFDSAVDDDTVAGVQVPLLPFGMQANVPARDVHKLMVRMAVPRATPALDETGASQA